MSSGIMGDPRKCAKAIFTFVGTSAVHGNYAVGIYRKQDVKMILGSFLEGFIIFDAINSRKTLLPHKLLLNI